MMFIQFIYNYCTDFVINVANITNLSYYEVNYLFFLVLYPLFFVGSILLYAIQLYRWGKLKRSQKAD